MTYAELRARGTQGELYSGVWGDEKTVVVTNDSLATLARFKNPDDAVLFVHWRENFDVLLKLLAQVRDSMVNPKIKLPALADVQQAIQRAEQ